MRAARAGRRQAVCAPGVRTTRRRLYTRGACGPPAGRMRAGRADRRQAV